MDKKSAYRFSPYRLFNCWSNYLSDSLKRYSEQPKPIYKEIFKWEEPRRVDQILAEKFPYLKEEKESKYEKEINICQQAINCLLEMEKDSPPGEIPSFKDWIDIWTLLNSKDT